MTIRIYKFVKRTETHKNHDGVDPKIYIGSVLNICEPVFFGLFLFFFCLTYYTVLNYRYKRDMAVQEEYRDLRLINLSLYKRN